ncbi:MAG: formylglycine-generating enzyme family protein [Deltaproteobacteria bacterium]|nr:formylglycine-generating enzyme family protein [Deltaproteobacteria bacterium]
MKKIIIFIITMMSVSITNMPCYAESQWITFNNPDSVKSMENQIYKTVLEMAESKQITPYKKTKDLEDRYDRERDKIEHNWNIQFESLQSKFINAFDNLSIARSGVGAYEAQKKMVKAKERQLEKEKERLKEHKASIKTMLDDIPYEIVVGGVIPEEGKTRKQLSNILTVSMGQEAVRQVNGVEIQSYSIVKNNTLVRDMISGVTQGHYKPVVDYDEPLEGLDESRSETTQIEVRIYQVYPFALKEGTVCVGEAAQARIRILKNNNYDQWLRTIGLGENSRVKSWVEAQLDRISSRNSDVENAIQSRMDQWSRRQQIIKTNIRKMGQNLKELKAKLKDFKGFSVVLAEKEWQEAQRGYQKHLQSRLALIRKQERGAKGPTDTKQTHWANLSTATMSAVQDRSGSYTEKILVVNFGEQQEYSEQAITFKEKKEAFKILYITLYKEGARIIYSASIGYKLALSPIEGRGSQTEPLPVQKKVKSFTVKGVSFKMIRIPAGEFMMGSPPNEKWRKSSEAQHRVTISRSFYMGETEVTQGLWRAVMGNNPSYFKNCGENCPVEKVDWNNCQEFIRKLNQKTGMKFRLPTEAEWEYAARAGTTTTIYAGAMNIIAKNNCPEIDAIAWYAGNSCVNYNGGEKCSHWGTRQYSCSHCGTNPVGQKQPNAWGLYDMLGNVSEWCQDWYGKTYYSNSPSKDPTGPSSGSYRVVRGNGWGIDAWGCRTASRGAGKPGWRNNAKGLRLALPLGP